MKINKLIIRILHLFGFQKNVYHIDDVMCKILLSDALYDEFWNYELLDWREKLLIDSPLYFVDETKNQIKAKFELDLKFENRCRNVNQVYAAFYRNHDKVRKGGMVKTFYYDGDVLFYPTYDKAAYKEYMKKKEEQK